MKFNCAREELQNSLSIVSKAVSNRTTLPILECVLLNANTTEGLYIMSNDMELAIQSAPIPAIIEENGSVALEAKLFSEIIRRVNGDTVYISVDEKNMAVISCGNSEFKIVGQSGEDFPPLPAVEKNIKYSISQPELKNMIRQTIFSIAQDESKPVLTGELIEFQNTKMSIVSVDGYRISYKESSIEKDCAYASVIVPGKALNEIGKILFQNTEEMANIYITEKHILFDLSGNIVVSRLIEGDYIKYAQSFTEDFKSKIIIDKTAMIQALERASLISRDSRKIPVKIELSQNNMIITSNTDIGTAYEELEIELEGDSLKIAFNPRYLIEALKVIEDEKVSIQFTTPLSPCIIKPIEKEYYKYLILPLRI